MHRPFHTPSRIVVPLIVLLLALPAVGSAQSLDKVKLLPKAGPTPSLTVDQMSVTRASDFPVVVFPGGKGFPSLQAAIDHVNGVKKTGKASSRFAFVLQPGSTFSGNYNLPDGIQIVGLGGHEVCRIFGAPGVNQPVLSYTAPVGVFGEITLIGVHVFGDTSSALDIRSNGSAVDYYIYDCRIETGATQAVPAISMSGTGHPNDDPINLQLFRTEVQAVDGNGAQAAIQADVTKYGWISLMNSEIESNGDGIRLTAQDPAESGVAVWNSIISDTVRGIVLDNAEDCIVHRSYIESSGPSIDLMGPLTADIQYCTLLSANGNGLRLDSGTAGVSTASVSFCGFLSFSTIYTGTNWTVNRPQNLNHHNNVAF